MTMFGPQITYTLAACGVAGSCAVCDARTRRIPNAITLPAMLAGLLLHFGLDGWRGLGLSAAAGLLAGLLFLFFHLAGGMGAGDVKLMAAVGFLSGSNSIVEIVIATALAGGVLAIALALARGRLKQTLSNVLILLAHHRSAGLRPHPELNVASSSTLRIPYGIAIAAGCLITLATRLHQA